jgi:hypothetical protein
MPRAKFGKKTEKCPTSAPERRMSKNSGSENFDQLKLDVISTETIY